MMELDKTFVCEQRVAEQQKIKRMLSSRRTVVKPHKHDCNDLQKPKRVVQLAWLGGQS
jgi:hypothetical protein